MIPLGVGIFACADAPAVPMAPTGLVLKAADRPSWVQGPLFMICSARANLRRDDGKISNEVQRGFVQFYFVE